MDPPTLTVRPGTTVTWELPDRYRDSVVPLRDGAADVCRAFAPWTGGPEDLTGPLPRNASGVFVLDGSGEDEEEVGSTVTDETWASPDNVGVSLRLEWDEVQPERGRYDWSGLDRELDRAVANGKLFNVSIKAGYHGTPSWIFDAGVERLVFRDHGTHGRDECACGAFMELGSPTDPRYRELYLEVLGALADHLRGNAAYYRSLAYIKPSGANLYSAEARLPKRCNCERSCPNAPCPVPPRFRDAPNLGPDGRICNTEVWAKSGYTPEGLYAFFADQERVLAERFPDKDMNFMLIHSGFPLVESADRYLRCGQDPKTAPIGATDQTKELLERGWKQLGARFSIMHAGVQPNHPVNRMLRTQREEGQIVGLQTHNEVRGPTDLVKTMRNGLDSTPVTFFEIYEAAASTSSAVLPALNAELHDRRRAMARGDGPLRDPYPTTHQHTFLEPGETRYVDPYRCVGKSSVGVIRVVAN
ncbi:MAG: beta-galactosidase [Alphaproteobacteria bacterium]|nr:beta-galactosidase [Alphaproteobacteria bacterium]MCB9696246.1 beta-galactosidase [Alphaproteobacteria bacterium]